jgi:two-component system, OmpR family, sensor kinase
VAHGRPSPAFSALDIMLRTKLALAFLGLLGPALIMGLLLYWAPRQMEQRLERSLLAHRQVQVYLELALDVYRHFRQLDQEPTYGQAVEPEELSATRHRLARDLEELRRLTLDELAFVGQAEPEERAELERLMHFEQLLEQTVELLSHAGSETNAGALAADTDRLDRELGALIDEVIQDESTEAEVADGQARRLTGRLTTLAIAVVTISAICAALTALWARRRIQAPIDALIEGTRQIARGGLDHRVRVFGHDELTDLAVSFNWMVAELERRRIELDRSRADLERKVEERTQELKQSNQTLHEVDLARRRMFADISHAFRTPLTVIRGEAEVTLRARQSRSRHYRAALERIVETAAELNKLVEDLLQVARSETAALRVDPIEIAAGELVRGVADDARALAASKGIRVLCEVTREAIRIRGDPDRLRQLLLILLDNASRYTRAHGEISIALAKVAPHAIITVRDTGIGIPPDELDLVASRFYRGSNASQMAPSGGGLGLHVAQSIVEAHGGHLAIESALNRGTTVRIRLPLLQEPEAFDERAAG